MSAERMGDPDALDALSGRATAAATALRTLASDVPKVADGLVGTSWRGIAASVFKVQAQVEAVALDNAAKAYTDAAFALSQLAQVLRDAQTVMDLAAAKSRSVYAQAQQAYASNPQAPETRSILEQAQAIMQETMRVYEAAKTEARNASLQAAGTFAEIAGRAKPPKKRKKAKLTRTQELSGRALGWLADKEADLGEGLTSLPYVGKPLKAPVWLFLADRETADVYKKYLRVGWEGLSTSEKAIASTFPATHIPGGGGILKVGKAAPKAPRFVDDALEGAGLLRKHIDDAGKAADELPRRPPADPPPRTIDEILRDPVGEPILLGKHSKAQPQNPKSAVPRPARPIAPTELGYRGAGFGTADAARAIAPSDAKVVDHLFRPELVLAKNGSVSLQGLHHIDGVRDLGGQVQVLKRTAIRGGGGATMVTYRVNVGSGEWMTKTSSFFPDAWTKVDVKNAITSIRANPTNVMRQAGDGGIRLYGFYKGVHVKVVLNRDGSLKTAFPLY